MRDPFDKTFGREYEVALMQGDKRFGSPCNHEVVRRGRCVNCMRKVIKRGGKK